MEWASDTSCQLTLSRHDSFEAALKSKDATIRSLKVDYPLDAALHRHAVADVSYARFRLQESGAMARLDPDADDFQDQVEDHVAELVETVPALRGSPVAPRSGAPFPGGQSGSKQLTCEELAGMTPEEVNRARERGELNALLGRPW